MLWDTLTSITNWPKHCRSLVKQNDPKFFGETKAIRFYGLCGHCYKSPFIVEINAKEFVEPEIEKATITVYFSVGYCLHAEYDFCKYRNYSHVNDKRHNIHAMDAILIDLDDTNITTFGQISNRNSKTIYNANHLQINKQQREHDLIGQSLHLQQQKDHLSFKKPKKSMSQNQIGILQDVMVGMEISYTIASYSSVLLFQIASVLKMPIFMDGTENLCKPYTLESTKEVLRPIFHGLWLQSLVRSAAAPISFIVTSRRDVIHFANKFFCFWNRMKRIAKLHKLLFSIYCFMIDCSMVYIIALCNIVNMVSVADYKKEAFDYITNSDPNKDVFIYTIIILCLFHQLGGVRRWVQKQNELTIYKRKAIKSLLMKSIKFINFAIEWVLVVILVLYLSTIEYFRIVSHNINGNNNLIGSISNNIVEINIAGTLSKPNIESLIFENQIDVEARDQSEAEPPLMTENIKEDIMSELEEDSINNEHIHYNKRYNFYPYHDDLSIMFSIIEIGRGNDTKYYLIVSEIDFSYEINKRDDCTFENPIYCIKLTKYWRDWWMKLIPFMTRSLFDINLPTCDNVSEIMNKIYKHNIPEFQIPRRLDNAASILIQVVPKGQKRWLLQNLREYGKMKKLKQMIARVLKSTADEGSNENKENIFDGTTILRNKTIDDENTIKIFKQWEGEMNLQKLAVSFEILNEQWLKYKDNNYVDSKIKFTKNQFNNMSHERHVLNDKDWHVEFRNFLQLEYDTLLENKKK